MNLYITIGRIFLGISLVGIGVLHFFFPGIRPIILPDVTVVFSNAYWIANAIALALISCGFLLCINQKVLIISLTVAITFFLLFAFGHLPLYLSAAGRVGKLKYWVNLNKTLALSGGFLVLASVEARRFASFHSLSKKLSLPGRCFFAIMLFLFGLGHLISTASLSSMVPSYIPFATFWTFAGGIILVGSAISFFTGYKMHAGGLMLAITLFIWLLSLHLYYTVLSPQWQEGENFIGSLTCLAFCGTALLISQLSNPVVVARHPANE